MSKKGWITLMLVISCFLAGTLHVQIEPEKNRTLKNPAQLDSLIMQTTYDFRISSGQVRIQTIPHDSLFERKIYTLSVPERFSKTTFHHHLNARLHPLDVNIFGEVQFPEQDLDLALVYNNTVHRTIRIRSDDELDNPAIQIPRLPGH